MALKFFKQLFGGGSIDIEIKDEPLWKEVTSLPQVKRTHRIGMDKNFHVGRVKRVSACRNYMLIDALEMCSGDNDQTYQANYNLWLYFPKDWKSVVSKDLTGQWVVFGFYVQSFRVKDVSDQFTTVLTCKFLNAIETEEEAKSLAIDIMESKLFVEHPYLKLSNIKLNYKQKCGEQEEETQI